MRPLVFILLASLLVACGPQAAGSTSQEGAAPAQTALADDAVARVNGVVIPRTAYEQLVAQRTQGLNLLPQEVALLRARLLDSLIEQELIRQAAAQANIQVSEAEAMAELLKIKGAMPNKAAWEDYLRLNQLSEADFLAAQYDALLTQRLRDLIFADLSQEVLQVQARHILVKTEGEAKSVLAQLQNGADFGALARQFSQDASTRDDGGLLGWFTQEELLDGRLAEVAFSLEVGATAGPIPSSLGYHVLQVLDRQQRAIEPERLAVLMESRYNRWLEAQWRAAQIEIVQ
ncbi:MAG: peptidylprolyl isomerase [Anaerolineae bacterium]|nr:peptidylprolyl isomerase [Anaerolineae bacterium]MDW8172652.1 peptidylprolyl isomerase [Anaerolineae bacterium]